MDLDTLLRDAGRGPTVDLDVAATHAAGRRRTIVRRATLAGGGALALSAVVVGAVSVLSPAMLEPDIADQPPATTTTGATSIGELLRHGADQGDVTLEVTAADVAAAAGTDLVSLDWQQADGHFEATRFLTSGATTTWQAATGTPAGPVVANDASVWWMSDDGAAHRAPAGGGTPTKMLDPDGGYGWLPIGTVSGTDQVIVSLVPIEQPVTERRNGLGLVTPDGTFADLPIQGEANVFPTGPIVAAHKNGQAVVLGVATDDALQVHGARLGEVLELVTELPRRDERPGSTLGAGVGVVGDDYWIVEAGATTGEGLAVHIHPLDGGEQTTLEIPATLAEDRWPTGLSVSPSGEVVLLRTTNATTFEPGTLVLFPSAREGDPWRAARTVTTPGIMSAIRPTPAAADVQEPPLECGLILGHPDDQRPIDPAQLEELFGELPEPSQDASDCLARAIEQRQAAVLHIATLTVEGDPILQIVRADSDGVIEVTHDATHDAFGSGQITTRTHTCGWDIQLNEPASC